MPSLSPTLRVWAIGIFVSISGALFGGDTGSIGSITEMPQFTRHFGQLSEVMRGFVVAVILVPSALTGLLAGSVSDRISRKKTISLGCAIFAIGSALSAGAPNLATLIVGRSIAGSGEGFFLSASTVYLCEISPKHSRGKLICTYQIFITTAIALGFFVVYGTINIASSYSWRLPFILSTITAATVAVGAPFLPYSPRWLMMHGRKPEAELVLNLVTGPEDEEERKELLSVPHVQGQKVAWVDIFAKGVRGRTLLGAFLNVFQQLSGIDFVLFYAPLIFSQAGLDPSTSSFIASGVTGILLAVMSALGSFYVDKIGRRPLIIYGGMSVATCHLCIGSLYASGGAYTKVGKWAVIVLIELFAITFAGSWALCTRLYSSEIQPSRTRSAASSFGQGANQLVNTVVALTSPAFLAKSSYGPYYLYGGLMAFGTAIAFLYMPETIGKTLESIEETFQGSAVAVAWPSIVLRETENLRQRRPSRRRSSAHTDENGRPTFPGRIGMERLGSSAIMGSAIEE
ncbi:general substrate transporter [Meredithblackwellia eburnea MCA 4105]